MPALDQISNTVVGSDSPATTQLAITPSDTTDLTYITRAIYIGAAGNLVVTPLQGGSDVTYAVLAGQILPVRVTRVKATGTTATGIVAWS